VSTDDFKQAWQSQPGSERLTIDADVLLKEVQRNQRSFSRMLFWRDAREVGIAVVMVPLWIYLGIAPRERPPWAWFLMVPVLIWVAGFMVAHRLRGKRLLPEPAAPLREQVQGSLEQVERQIWLLRNVHWWALSPCAAAMAAFFGHAAWVSRWEGWLSVVVVLSVSVLAAAILIAIYWVNQIAIRQELEPRKKELEKLLGSLGEEELPGAGA
jgi:hypothetical protein